MRPLLLLLSLGLSALATAQPHEHEEEEHEHEELVDGLSRALGMTRAEVEAMGLSPDEERLLLEGFATETIVVGSRAEPRSVTASAVPVDVLSATDLASQGALDLKDQLRNVVPSLNVNDQPIAGMASIVRPALLRNLAPDHTLVLLNGKRRHRSSVVDWHGGNGVAFGSQGADISTLPSIAIRQVEVLRDGAAAQYGSDAIAGVLNFQLKDASSGGSVSFTAGAHGEGDGESGRFAANFGLPLGASGFANLSLEYGASAATSRTAARTDALALIAAGNTHVASEAPQRWGRPSVEDDLKLFGNFGYTAAGGVQTYAHANYASRKVTQGFFFRNPNTRLGVYSNDGGATLLIADALQAAGTGSAGCPVVRITDHVPDPVALRQVFADPDCFTFQELLPGGFTPQMGAVARDAAVTAGMRGFHANGFQWDVSGAIGAHETDTFIRDTVNASLGPASPTTFDPGSAVQREINLNVDLSYHLSERVHLSGGAEWRNEAYEVLQGDEASWAVGPYGRQGFTSGSNGFFGYSPLHAGRWDRSSTAGYLDLELHEEEDWTAGAAVRLEDFEDFGTTLNGKLTGRFRFLRAGVSTGFRAPTPGQQNAFNIASWFDPSVGDLINLGAIPPTSPLAALRGGKPLGPERSVNYTFGAVLEAGTVSVTADYFRIELSDRIGITSNFTLTEPEIVELETAGIAAARDLRRFRFFTNAFSTRSHGIDVVGTWTPLALRGNTTVSAAWNHTRSQVTENEGGLLDDRRITEYAYALPRNRGNVTVVHHAGPARMLGRLSYYGGWYDFDSGYAQIFDPSAGLEQGFFNGRPIVDLEVTLDVRNNVTLTVGGQNALNTYSQVTARAGDVGEKYSEYTPWGMSGGYYYVRLGYDWGQ